MGSGYYDCDVCQQKDIDRKGSPHQCPGSIKDRLQSLEFNPPEEKTINVEEQRAWTKFFASNMAVAMAHTPLPRDRTDIPKMFNNLAKGSAIIADKMLDEWKKRYG
jgi:hypothetical protein